MRRTSRIWLLPLGLVVMAWIFPILWTAVTSFKNLEKPGTLRPDTFTPTFDNYVQVFAERDFGNLLKNSILVAGGATIATMFLACMASYALSRRRFRGGETVNSWVLSLRMIPPIVVVVPFFLMLDTVNFLDTYHGLFLVYLSFSLPFAIFMLTGFFSEIPLSLDEAASADGAGPMKTLFRIVVPSARSGIAVTTIFTFIFAWNEFLFAFLLTRDKWVTAPVLLAATATPFQTDWGRLTAGGIMLFLPLLIIVFVLQREIARGMTFGAVKG